MNFLSRFSSLLIIFTACIHTFAEGSQEAKIHSAFLKQRIYESLRQANCFTSIDKRTFSGVHPSGIAEAQRYLDKMGEDYAIYEPDPSLVSSYVNFMCKHKSTGTHGVLPELPPEYAVCF